MARDRGVEVGAQALQERIAGRVAEGVVVLLEAVEVEEREACAGRRPSPASAASSRSRISARRLASPVRPSVSDSWRLARSRRRFSRKSMPPRAPATSSAAVASSAAAEVHGRELTDDEHGERDGGEARGQGQRAAGDLLDRPARHELPRGGRGERGPRGHSVSTHEPAT